MATTRRGMLALTGLAGGALVEAGLTGGRPGLARPALAQEAWPSRPIRVIVPFPAGGTTDMLARLYGQRLTETLGQSVLVENRGGGGGSIGAEVVARAAPDGHTLLFHNLRPAIRQPGAA
jgi:tripartite-type tricarboxylate transporter receptor subunit TctC